MKRNLPEVVSIGTDRLELLIKERVTELKKQNDWLGPFGLLVALLSTLVVTDFKERFKLSGDQWQMLFIIASLGSAVWLFRAIKLSRKAPTAERILDDIFESARITHESRALFFIRAHFSDNVDRLLVFRDRIWGAYFLPHTRFDMTKSDNNSERSLTLVISQFLGISFDSLTVSHVIGGGLSSIKHSQYHQKESIYTFEFFHISISEPAPDHLLKRTFEVGGNELRWLALDEMEADDVTRRQNIDVTRHLKNLYDLFFRQSTPSIKATLD